MKTSFHKATASYHINQVDSLRLHRQMPGYSSRKLYNTCNFNIYIYLQVRLENKTVNIFSL